MRVMTLKPPFNYKLYYRFKAYRQTMVPRMSPTSSRGSTERLSFQTKTRVVGVGACANGLGVKRKTCGLTTYLSVTALRCSACVNKVIMLHQFFQWLTVGTWLSDYPYTYFLQIFDSKPLRSS
jgi:hypothetical protein